MDNSLQNCVGALESHNHNEKVSFLYTENFLIFNISYLSDNFFLSFLRFFCYSIAETLKK